MSMRAASVLYAHKNMLVRSVREQLLRIRPFLWNLMPKLLSFGLSRTDHLLP